MVKKNNEINKKINPDEIIPLVSALIGYEKVNFLENAFPNPPLNENAPVWQEIIMLIYIAQNKNMDNIFNLKKKDIKQKKNKKPKKYIIENNDNNDNKKKNNNKSLIKSCPAK